MGVSASNQQLRRKPLGLGMRLVPSAESTRGSYWNAEPRVILANKSDYIVSYWVIEENKNRTEVQQERIAECIGRNLNAKNSKTAARARMSNDQIEKKQSVTTEEQEEEVEEEEEEEEGVEVKEEEEEEECVVNNNNITAGSSVSEHHFSNKQKQNALDADEDQDSEDEDDDEVYILAIDHRMGRKGTTRPTQVPFPADCQHMRVCGFYYHDGEWKRYEDKVYSIALIHRKFHVTATTSNVKPYDPTQETEQATKRR